MDEMNYERILTNKQARLKRIDAIIELVNIAEETGKSILDSNKMRG